MEDNRAEQREALEVLMEFNERLVKNMKIIVKELSGERLDDTDNFLKAIIDGINWEVQVVNGTMELLNEDEIRIHKEEINSKIVALGNAVAEKEDKKMAAAMNELIPVFETLGAAAKDAVQKINKLDRIRKYRFVLRKSEFL